MKSICRWEQKLNHMMSYLLNPSLLITRLIIGNMFFWAGLGKLKNLERTISFFTSLNIPFPQAQAPFVATIELLGGALIILGLYTRISAILLSGVMVVATLTTQLDKIESFKSLASVKEILYLLILLLIAAIGAGKISIDSKRKC